MSDIEELFANQVLELRRGTIVLAILSTLAQPRYGYALLQSLEDSGISVDAGTLYPLLRRLEKQQVLASAWDTSDVRPRKYYHLSQKGQKLYERLRAEWQSNQDILNNMMQR